MTPSSDSVDTTTALPPSHPNYLKRALWVAGIVIAVLIIIYAAASPILAKMAESRIKSGLEDRFASDLQIQNLKVSVFPTVTVSGENLVFHRKNHPTDPALIQIAKFTASGNIVGLLFRHLSSVDLVGLDIKVPPKDESGQKPPHDTGKTAYFVVDTINADGTKLSTIPRESWKDPLVFDIKTLRIHGAGSTTPLSFDAVLINAKPPGEIRSKGSFGPWDKDEPGDTPVSGDYTFRNADLGVFKGIAGTLSSDGNYKGTLGRIEASGHTDVPNFMVTMAGNPVHLTTDYHAIIDGTSGDTDLEPVTGKFGHSIIVAKGSVAATKGVKGKTVSLDAIVTQGRLEDMLLLAVHSKTPPLSGAIAFHSKIVIPPGDIDVVHKLKLDGAFSVAEAQFAKLDVQEKVDKLSHRAEGETNDAEAPTVASDFKGAFTLGDAILNLRDLSFNMPGVGVALNGSYGLPDQSLHFKGTVTLAAKLSQTTTGFKSLLLKAVDPFFKKKGSKEGSVVPITISGTQSDPKFGLDILHRDGK